MKTNITFIVLNKRLKKEVAKNLAEKLDMFYVDINDKVKYDLLNINTVISIAGLEYYNKIETKTVDSIASYENALITLDLDTFFNNDNYKILKNTSLFIYLRLDFDKYKEFLDRDIPKSSRLEKSLNKKVFKERDTLLKYVSDIVVEFNSNENIIDLILNAIKDYYKEVL